MKEYPKVDTIFKRDMDSEHKNLIIGEYANPTLEYLANNRWEFTEKVDGTNIRVMVKQRLLMPPGLEWGGKTDTAQIPATLIKHLQDTFYPLTDKLHEMFPNEACLYGEGFGAGIQKGGGNYRKDQGFVLFDVWVPDEESKTGGWWLERNNILDIAEKLGIPAVPVISYGTLADAVAMTQAGFPSIWGDFKAEGIIAKPMIGPERTPEEVIDKFREVAYDPQYAKVTI